MAIIKRLSALAALMIIGCAPSELRPVDIFPEDNCSGCRMAISEESSASEIINDRAEVFKFDDLVCLEKFRKNTPALVIGAMFVKDYETKDWIPYEKSTIVRTGVRTPMGSGKAAFRNPDKAREFASQHPPDLPAGETDGCCDRGAD